MFDILATFIRDLGYPVNAVKMWDADVPGIRSKAQLTLSSDHVLARHEVQPGTISVICGYMQHLCVNDDQYRRCFLPWYPDDADTYWRLTIAGKPVPDCATIRGVRNAWGLWGASYLCFYPSPTVGNEANIDFTFHLGAAHYWGVGVDYRVGGRMIGFDVPDSEWQKQQSKGVGPEYEPLRSQS